MVRAVLTSEPASEVSLASFPFSASAAASSAVAGRLLCPAREARRFAWLAPTQAARELAEARALGAAAARLPEFLGRTWGDVAPLLLRAWAGRHDEICHERHDPRTTFHGVREGWSGAGGAA